MKKAKLIPSVVFTLHTLRAALTGLAKAVNRHSTLPIIADTALLVRQAGELTLTATDLDQFLTFRIPAPSMPRTQLARELFESKNQREACSFIVPMSILREVCKAADRNFQIVLHPMSVEYAVNGQHLTRSLYSPGITEAGAFDPSEFPPVPPDISDIDPILLEHESRTRARYAMDCITSDETRYVLQGIYFDKSQNAMVGTDGRHLIKVPMDLSGLSESFILHESAVLFNKPFVSSDWRLRYKPFPKTKDVKHGGEIRIDSGEWTLRTRAIEGEFPNWMQVVPTARPIATVQFAPAQANELQDVLPKLPTGERERYGNSQPEQKIGVEIRSDYIVFTANGTSYAAQNVKVKGKFAPFTIALNRQFFIKAFRYGLNTMEVISALEPILFKGDNGTLVAMPFRPVEEAKKAA